MSAYDKAEAFEIPEKYTALLQRMETLFDITIEEPHAIPLRNIYHTFVYGYAKGFTLSHCTSSLIDGPGYDYHKEIMEILSHCGFEVSDSYGDNGMDPSTNWRDTYWHYDIIYSPSKFYCDYEDDESDEEDGEEYDEDYDIIQREVAQRWSEDCF